jgi:hypothetical protein
LRWRLTCWAQFDKLLNVTLCYPENDKTPFYDMLSGKLTRIVVRVNLVPWMKSCTAITLTIRI